MADCLSSRVTHYLSTSSRLLNDLNHSPTLSRRQGARFYNSHDISNVRTNFIVRHELGPASYIALVLLVANLPLNSHDDRLLHLVTGHQTDFLLAAMFWRCSSRLSRRIGERFTGHLADRVRARLIGGLAGALILLYILFHSL